MSPTENDLRRALRQGENGDAPDARRIVDRVVARSRRRHRALSVAAAVVVVAGVTTGVAFLARDAHPAGTTEAGPAIGIRRTPVSRTPAATPARTCPDVPTVPATGTGSGRLFAEQPVAVTLCVYGGSGVALGTPAGRDRPAAIASRTLTGAAATALTTSLEDASTGPLHVMCPDYISVDARTLVVLATAPGGRQLAPVVTQLGRPTCQVTVTNGAVRRFGWTPPASLVGDLPTLSTHPQPGTSSDTRH